MNHPKSLRQDERTAEQETFRRVEQMQKRNKSSRRDEKCPSSRERSSRSRNSGTLRCSRSQSAAREGGKHTSRGEKKGGSCQQLSRGRSVKQYGRDENSGSKKEKSWSRSSSRNRSVRTKEDGGNTFSNKDSSSRGRSPSWIQTPPSDELSPTHSHRLQLSPVADFHRFDSMMKNVVQCNSPLRSQGTRSKDKGVIVQKLRPERTQKRLHEPRVHPQPRACSSPPCLITSVEDAASRRKVSCTDMDIIQDAATSTSRLKELCMDIIQSAKDGTSPPQRAKIKEIVTQYHKSHHQGAVSPRDPNFTEIPPEYSRVLTYGLARSQTVQTQRSNVAAGCTGSRSRFREMKDD